MLDPGARRETRACSFVSAIPIMVSYHKIFRPVLLPTFTHVCEGQLRAEQTTTDCTTATPFTPRLERTSSCPFALHAPQLQRQCASLANKHQRIMDKSRGTSNIVTTLILTVPQHQIFMYLRSPRPWWSGGDILAIFGAKVQVVHQPTQLSHLGRVRHIVILDC